LDPVQAPEIPVVINSDHFSDTSEDLIENQQNESVTADTPDHHREHFHQTTEALVRIKEHGILAPDLE
jgi:hypothetical protein